MAATCGHAGDQPEQVEGAQVDHRVEHAHDDEPDGLPGHAVAVQEPANQVHDSPQSAAVRARRRRAAYMLTSPRPLVALHEQR